MSLFNKKNKEKEEKPKKIGKNKKQEIQSAPVESAEDEMARLDSQLGIELLHTGYMMVPQKQEPNGEMLYLNITTKGSQMFYAAESIAAYEEFARKMREQNGGSPDKVQCLDLKNGNHKDYGIVKTTFSAAVKILDSTESEGFLYLLKDGRGLRLTTRMVRELSRRYSILQEMAFEEEQRRQREEYEQRMQIQRSQNDSYYQDSSSFSVPSSYNSASYSEASPNYNTPAFHSPQPTFGASQQASMYVQVDDRLKKHFENMLDVLGNVDAFNMWSANEMYAIGYVLNKMYNAGDAENYKTKIKNWVRWAKQEPVDAKTLALMIMMEIYDNLQNDDGATERDIQMAKNKYEAVRKRVEGDATNISFGIVPKQCVPVWCIEACKEYAAKKKKELHERFISTCVEQGINAVNAEKYYEMLSMNHKLVMLELDYCIKTGRFKKYGVQKLPSPQNGNMMTIEEILSGIGLNVQEGTHQFKKAIIAGYIKAVGAMRK